MGITPFTILTNYSVLCLPMASLAPRASVFWSDSTMNDYFPDDSDVEQQQRLVDSDDELNDGRTPVCCLSLGFFVTARLI